MRRRQEQVDQALAYGNPSPWRRLAWARTADSQRSSIDARRAGPGARSGKPYRQALRLARNAWTCDRNLALPGRDASRLHARRVALRSQASALGPRALGVQAQACASGARRLRLARRANCLAFPSLGSLRARVGGLGAKPWARRSGWARLRLGCCGLRSRSIRRRAERNGLRPWRLALRARLFCFATGAARDVAEARRLTGGARRAAVASFDPAGKPGRGA